MFTAPAKAVRGRPSKASNAELELLALRAAVTRFALATGRGRRVRDRLSSQHHLGVEATKNEYAELIRLVMASRCPADL